MTISQEYVFLSLSSSSNTNLENELSITNIDWTEDDQYFQFTGEHKNAFTGKMPGAY